MQRPASPPANDETAAQTPDDEPHPLMMKYVYKPSQVILNNLPYIVAGFLFLFLLPWIIQLYTYTLKSAGLLIDSILVLHEGEVLLHESVSEVSNRTRFAVDSSRPDERSAGLLYAEPTVGGFASVWMDANAGDGHLDLEMLFKAVIARPEVFASLFAAERRP